jgi:hypothetical protein
VCGSGGDAGLPGTTMTGRVLSPGGLVPISGALVWFSKTEPAPIPDHAYPETCTNPAGPYGFSRPDGAFTVAPAPGDYYLVVQKGQFRRVRQITVPAQGPVAVPEDQTTLPSKNGVGDTIPNMALVYALSGGDHIEDVLAKLGMGQVGSDHLLVMGTEEFDIYNVYPYESNSALLTDLERMKGYHILFFPCTIAGSPQISDPTAPLSDPAVLQNIRDYLAAGGKIYATDMMYDIFEQSLPEYVDLCGDDAVMNDADQTAWASSQTMSGWTSHGKAVDPDLAAWLDAIGQSSQAIDFHENFVWIEGLYTTPEPGPGDPQPPKVWVTGDFVLQAGQTLPLTITFPYGAGKVLFSTYHTVGDPGGSAGHVGIYPQEWVLVYLIMEIGVCTSPVL